MGHPHRGNILFLILLAVVLFAALSYAVTQSTRGGGNDASNEKGQSQAADMLNYFAQLDAAVQRMMLTGGVKDYELNFYYQSPDRYVASPNDNPNCTESRCRVFDPAGGAVAGRTFDNYMRVGPVAPRIYYVSVPGVGTSAPDIVYQQGGINSKICLEINRKMGLTDSINGVDMTSHNGWMYQNTIPLGPIVDNGNAVTGFPLALGSYGTFCTCQTTSLDACAIPSTSMRPWLMHVLVAR